MIYVHVWICLLSHKSNLNCLHSFAMDTFQLFFVDLKFHSTTLPELYVCSGEMWSEHEEGEVSFV